MKKTSIIDIELKRMGKRIRNRRVSLCRAISQLAKDTGLPEGYIKDVEKGKMPSFQSLKRIARALKITTKELLFGKRLASSVLSQAPPNISCKLSPKEKAEIAKRLKRIVKLLKGLDIKALNAAMSRTLR